MNGSPSGSRHCLCAVRGQWAVGYGVVRARVLSPCPLGRPGARVALELAKDPARMLATVQIGFTTTATLAGTFSGATLAERLADWLLLVPVLESYSQPLSIVVVTLGVTYTALIIGELAPKHIALSNPEAIAVRTARPIATLAHASAPLIWLLSKSTTLLLR